MSEQITRVSRIYSGTPIGGVLLKKVCDHLVEAYGSLNPKVLNNSSSIMGSHGLHTLTIEVVMDKPSTNNHSAYLALAPALFFYFGKDTDSYREASVEMLGPLHVNFQKEDDELTVQVVKDETGWDVPVDLLGADIEIIV